MYLRVKANATVGYDVNYTYVVGDDSQRHRWQCTTSLVPQLQLSLIFWGRASKVTKLFTLQKRIVRIITDKKPRESCTDAFRNMKILTLFSQYLFSLIVFTVENDYHFNLNKDIHKYNTRQNTNIHLPSQPDKISKGPLYIRRESI